MKHCTVSTVMSGWRPIWKQRPRSSLRARLNSSFLETRGCREKKPLKFSKFQELKEPLPFGSLSPRLDFLFFSFSFLFFFPVYRKSK